MENNLNLNKIKLNLFDLFNSKLFSSEEQVNFNLFLKGKSSSNSDKEVNNIFRYISYFDLGISLCYKNNLLENIILYNEGIYNYKMFNASIIGVDQLPYKINFSFRNVNIVEMFGDTKVKGGGNNASIWLAYEDLGIEFNFLSKLWTDLENPITFIQLFCKKICILYCSVCLKEVDSNNKLVCDNDCNIVKYCSSNCKSTHLPFHLKYCK